MKRISFVMLAMCFVVVGFVSDSEAQWVYKYADMNYYVHQVLSFNTAVYSGYNGCGPTSALMMLLEHRLLQGYCPQYQMYEEYTDLKGNRYSEMANDWDGKGSYPHTNIKGMHGFVVDKGYKDGKEYWGASSGKIRVLFERHGLQITIIGGTHQVLMSYIKRMIDANLPMIGHVKVYPGAWGHYVVIRGYNGSQGIFVNDPFGDAQNTWNGKTSGENKLYSLFTSDGQPITIGKRVVLDRIYCLYPIGIFPDYPGWRTGVSQAINNAYLEMKGDKLAGHPFNTGKGRSIYVYKPNYYFGAPKPSGYDLYAHDLKQDNPDYPKLNNSGESVIMYSGKRSKAYFVYPGMVCKATEDGNCPIVYMGRRIDAVFCLGDDWIWHPFNDSVCYKNMGYLSDYSENVLLPKEIMDQFPIAANYYAYENRKRISYPLATVIAAAENAGRISLAIGGDEIDVPPSFEGDTGNGGGTSSGPSPSSPPSSPPSQDNPNSFGVFTSYTPADLGITRARKIAISTGIIPLIDFSQGINTGWVCSSTKNDQPNSVKNWCFQWSCFVYVDYGVGYHPENVDIGGKVCFLDFSLPKDITDLIDRTLMYKFRVRAYSYGIPKNLAVVIGSVGAMIKEVDDAFSERTFESSNFYWYDFDRVMVKVRGCTVALIKVELVPVFPRSEVTEPPKPEIQGVIPLVDFTKGINTSWALGYVQNQKAREVKAGIRNNLPLLFVDYQGYHPERVEIDATEVSFSLPKAITDSIKRDQFYFFQAEIFSYGIPKGVSVCFLYSWAYGPRFYLKLQETDNSLKVRILTSERPFKWPEIFDTILFRVCGSDAGLIRIKLVPAASKDLAKEVIPQEISKEGYHKGLKISPNPFNSQTTITFSNPKAQDLTFKVFNLLGQEVVALLKGYYLGGEIRVGWDGKDEGGRELSTGLYLVRVTTQEEIQIEKVTLIR